MHLAHLTEDSIAINDSATSIVATNQTVEGENDVVDSKYLPESSTGSSHAAIAPFLDLNVIVTCCCLREPVCNRQPSEGGAICKRCTQKAGIYSGTCRQWDCVVETTRDHGSQSALQSDHFVACSKEPTYWLVVVLVLVILLIKFLAFAMCLSGVNNVIHNCVNLLRSAFFCYPCRRSVADRSKEKKRRTLNHNELDMAAAFVEEKQGVRDLTDLSIIEMESSMANDPTSIAKDNNSPSRTSQDQSSQSIQVELTQSLLSLRIDFPKLNLDDIDARDFEFLDGSRSLLASVRTMSNPNSARESYVEYEHKPGLKLRSYQ